MGTRGKCSLIRTKGLLHRWRRPICFVGKANTTLRSLATVAFSRAIQRFRSAGVAFDELAQYQFATKQYTSDLWRGAEDFVRGQSFSHAIRLLNEYLKYEPQLRNAEALLRLGQAHLALGEVPQSIAAF